MLLALTPAGAGEDVLLGVTWGDSALVSFDPYAGTILRKHVQLNPYEAFRALAHDPARHRVYALAQGSHNLYAIDTGTLDIAHIGNLRIDTRPAGYEFASALAYDRVTETLYTAIEHWESGSSDRLWSDLARVDPSDGGIEIVGRIDGGWIDSLAFSEADRHLYGLAFDGTGAWDSPFGARVVRIDPGTAATETIFLTPYHTMLGFALKPPFTFFSWINWTSHFYGETDLLTQTILPLGASDPVDVISAMLYMDFPVAPGPVVIRPAPASFLYGGVVTGVWDPGGVLGGKVREGHRFAGQLGYDATSPYRFPDPNGAAPYGLTLNIAGMRYSARGLDAQVVNNRFDGWDQSVSDAFWIEAESDQNAVISWDLLDDTARAIDNNSRLPDRFDLSAWSANRFLVTGYDPRFEDPVYFILGTVDRVTRRASPAARPGVRRPGPPAGR